MPKTAMLTRYSNKGRKVHSKLSRTFLYALQVDEATEEYVNDRDAVYSYATRQGLDSELVGAITACAFDKFGNRLKTEEAQRNFDTLVKRTFRKERT